MAVPNNHFLKVKGFFPWVLALWPWCSRWFTGQPHIKIGGEENPYLWRWYVIPRNPFFNLYLHRFMRDDDDRALHDHPWWFVSLVLWGGYYEHRAQLVVRHKRQSLGLVDVGRTVNERGLLSLAYRDTADRHKVALRRDANGKPLPCWTLVLTGRTKRVWGFWCADDFVPHDEFEVKGCGE